MYNMRIKRVIGLVALLAFVGFAGLGRADSSPSKTGDSPTNAEIAFAKRTMDLFFNEVFAALVQEFNETTTANVDEGKQAISLVFNDANRDMRLIGVFPPLLGGNNDRPGDLFEQRSLLLALRGQANTSVERVGDRWFYRRSVPLSNTLHPACVLCHTNFTPEFFNRTNNPGQWVGVLALRVPIKTD